MEVKNGMAKDLVCGMDVDVKTAKWKTIYKGKTYYFCAPGCKYEFDEDPEKYISGGGGGGMGGHTGHGCCCGGYC
jgi:YHS domain-containing protein